LEFIHCLTSSAVANNLEITSSIYQPTVSNDLHRSSGLGLVGHRAFFLIFERDPSRAAGFCSLP
jgi:hypothetical protein